MIHVTLAVLAIALTTTSECLPEHSVSPIPFFNFEQALQAGFAADGENQWAEPAKGPSFAQQWSCDLSYEAELRGMSFERGQGQLFFDRASKRYRMRSTSECSFFTPKATTVQDRLTVHSPVGRPDLPVSTLTLGHGGDDGVCIAFGPGLDYYVDIFGWARRANKVRPGRVGDQQCMVWYADIPSLDFSAAMCVTSTGIPLEMNHSYGKGSNSKMNMTTRFFNFTFEAPRDEVFALSEACSENFPTQPCESRGADQLDVYRIFGPPEPLALENRNAGDVLGDLSFVCTQGSGQLYRTKLITHWRVRVRTDFGQYALCNFDGRDNTCAGAPEQLKVVGRRSSQMQGCGPRLGQCSPNDDVGSQFSFPRESMCAPGVVPDDQDACAWGQAIAVRTIKASCVMEERGLLAACKREIGHAPFLEAAKVWLQAFASDDPSLGGCPEAHWWPSNVTEIII